MVISTTSIKTFHLKLSELVLQREHDNGTWPYEKETAGRNPSAVLTQMTLTPDLESFAAVVEHFVTMTLGSTHFLFLPVAVATVREGHGVRRVTTRLCAHINHPHSEIPTFATCTNMPSLDISMPSG